MGLERRLIPLPCFLNIGVEIGQLGLLLVLA